MNDFMCVLYVHAHTQRSRSQLEWLEWRSFDLPRAVSRRQFRNSSQDTLQRRAMLSSCFTCVRSASSVS